MRISSVLLAVLPAVLAADASEDLVNRPVPPAPGWKFLYNCNITMGYYIELGPGLKNTTRGVFPIQGGQFEGVEGLTGKVLSVGAEWSGYNELTSYFVSDARYQLQTQDRGEIYVTAHGSTGEDGLVYVHAKFETGSQKYLWMNDILAVGVMQTTKLGYMVDMWQVLAPKYGGANKFHGVANRRSVKDEI